MTYEPSAEANPYRLTEYEDAYEGGVVSLIEVLDADSNLLQARDAKAQAQTEAARAAIAAFRALGGGWDARHPGNDGLYTDLSINVIADSGLFIRVPPSPSVR